MVLRLLFIYVFLIFVKLEDTLFPGEAWYSGLINVGGSEERNLFYIVVKARNKNATAPLVVWLNGGPGSSSWLGFYYSIGPYRIDRKLLTFYRNIYAWNEFADMLFVDNPVGVGFSAINDTTKLCKSEACIATDFKHLLYGFVNKHSEYIGRDFYITGVSYAGRYIPSITAHLLKTSQNILKIKGIAIGNPDILGATQINREPEFVYENKIIGYITYLFAKAAVIVCRVADIVKMDSLVILYLCDNYLGGTFDLVNYYDIGEISSDEDNGTLLNKTLNGKEAKILLGVKDINYSAGSEEVYDALNDDQMESSAKDIEFIIENDINVLLFYGDKDTVCDWRTGEYVVESLNWSGAKKYKELQYKDWITEEKKVSGYYKKYKNFMFLVVKNAGHSVPSRQPKAALYMLKQFIYSF